MAQPYTEFRRDGWPLCPCCGEDELWSAFAWDGNDPKPPMQAWIDHGLRCYRCSWDSEQPRAPSVICQTCWEIHKRETSAPIQCGVCKQIVGCFWHDRNSRHIRDCMRAKAGLPPLVPLELF